MTTNLMARFFWAIRAEVMLTPPAVEFYSIATRLVSIIFQILHVGKWTDQKDNAYLDEAYMLSKEHHKPLQNCKFQCPEGETVSSLIVVYFLLLAALGKCCPLNCACFLVFCSYQRRHVECQVAFFLLQFLFALYCSESCSYCFSKAMFWAVCSLNLKNSVHVLN